MILLWCADIFNVAVEVWLAYWLFDVPKHRRFHQPWVRVLEYLGFLGIPGGNILFDRMMEIRFSNIQCLSVIAFSVLFALIFTKINLFCSIAWMGIYYMTLSLLELPGIVLSGWITGQPYLVCIYQSILYDYFYLVILSLVLLIVFIKLGALLKKYVNIAISKNNSIWWIIFAICEWWVITYFLYIGSLETGRAVFVYNFVSILCIVFLIFGFASFIVFRQSENQIQQRMLQDALMETDYVKIKEEYQRKSREIHDLKHHLQTLSVLLSVDKNDNAKQYLDNMMDDFVSMKNQIHAWTGNPLVDSLLSGKQSRADKLGVTLEIHSSQIVSKLSDRDMSILLGNLIDNAIEASANLNDKKVVTIKILNKSNMLFIHVKNRIGRAPLMRDGRLVTTKSDKINHGWGMKSIEAVVEKYDGQMDINYNEAYFEISITFWEDNEVSNDGKRN